MSDDRQQTEGSSSVVALVPEDFEVPVPLRTARFALQVLGPRHEQQDHRAWTRSIEHIRATPGFAGRRWPATATSRRQNLASLERHLREHEQRQAFAYAVVDPGDEEYLGCVYLAPPRTAPFDVDVRSWVRAERAELDAPLHDAVRQWLVDAWPWRRPDYARR